MGIVFVDGEQAGLEIFMPAFGPLEVHIWADNYLPISQPQRWWQIGPSMDLRFQDGGEKQFMVKSLGLSDEASWSITWFGFPLVGLFCLCAVLCLMALSAM